MKHTVAVFGAFHGFPDTRPFEDDASRTILESCVDSGSCVRSLSTVAISFLLLVLDVY